jgi:hypothetical protein
MGNQLSVYRLRLTIYGLNDFNGFNEFNDSPCALYLAPFINLDWADPEA